MGWGLMVVVALLISKILGKEARGTLYLGGARAFLVVLGGALRGYIGRVGTLVAIEAQELGTDDGTVLLARTLEQLLYHAVACRLALAVTALGLSAVESYEDDQSRHGATHHAHAAHATAKSGGYALGHRVVESVEVGKGSHHRLAASVALHEVVYRLLYTCAELGRESDIVVHDDRLFVVECGKYLDAILMVGHASRLAAAVHGQDGVAHVNPSQGYRRGQNVAQCASACHLAVVDKALAGHTRLVAQLGKDCRCDGVAGILLGGIELDDRTTAQHGVVGGVVLLGIVGVEGVGIVGRNHERPLYRLVVSLCGAALCQRYTL